MRQASPQDRIQVAEEALRDEQVATAEEVVEECLMADPDSGRAWELLGLIHASRGEDRQAVSALERASLLGPLRLEGRLCLGLTYGRLGKSVLACDLLTMVVDDASTSPEIILDAAAGLSELGRPNLAMTACRRAITKDRDLARGYYELGYYAAQCEYPMHLIEPLARRAVSLAPNEVRYRVGLVGILRQQNRDEEAYEVVSQLTNDDIVSLGCVCCVERIVDLYDAHGDHRRAVVARQRLLQLNS